MAFYNNTVVLSEMLSVFAALLVSSYLQIKLLTGLGKVSWNISYFETVGSDYAEATESKCKGLGIQRHLFIIQEIRIHVFF